MQSRLLQLFNIRVNEAWLVKNLFWLQFFQGVGVAIFNTVVFALFLQQFDVHELPKVYLLGALLLWVAGFSYSKAEHALPLKKLVPAVIIFVALSIIGFRLGYAIFDSPLFLFIMFGWYYVVYLLTNLEFWGLAALQFDIRQSKRLFGMIGAGDVPAKLIGYTAVPVLLQFVSSVNMLLFSAGFVLLSLVFYRRLARAGKLDIHVAHANSPQPEFTTQNARAVIKSFFGNRMIAFVALLSFIVVTCVTVISFSFYSEIKQYANTDDQLASFIAIFYASGRVLAIFVRLIFTGRIANILGVRGSLLISPAILIILLVGIIILPLFTDNKHAVLYVFGMMAIVTEVLKTSLQDPIFLSLMQPLTASLRLKGHTIIKGFMDPFALAFSGFMLFSFMKVSGSVDLIMLSYLILMLIIAWVVVVFVVDAEYVRALVTALNKRYSIGSELNLQDEKTFPVLKDKVAGGEQGEAIYILTLVRNNFAPALKELVLLAFKHPSRAVKNEALKLVIEKRITEAENEIEYILAHETESAFLADAVKAKYMLLPDKTEASDTLINSFHPNLKKAALVGLISSGDINAMVTAGQELLALSQSARSEDRMMAAAILGELKIQTFYKPLVRLLSDEDENVVKAAIIAAGHVRNARLMPLLADMFLKRRYEGLIIDAFIEAGDNALTDMSSLLSIVNLKHRQITRLIFAIGKIGTNRATQLLDELVWKLPSYRGHVFHSLHICRFTIKAQDSDKHVQLIHEYLESATYILFAIESLNPVKHQALIDALQIEFNEIRDSLMWLFSFMYDTEKMLKAKAAFQYINKESVANALELIEIAVPKTMSVKFCALFELSQVSEKCENLRAQFQKQIDFDDLADRIMNDREYHYHRWTKAVLTYSLLDYERARKIIWLQKMQQSEDELLKETANYVMAKSEV